MHICEFHRWTDVYTVYIGSIYVLYLRRVRVFGSEFILSGISFKLKIKMIHVKISNFIYIYCPT